MSPENKNGRQTTKRSRVDDVVVGRASSKEHTKGNFNHTPLISFQPPPDLVVTEEKLQDLLNYVNTQPKRNLKQKRNKKH